MMNLDSIAAAAAWLAAARNIVISTGAGMSAESGVPTFRDESGLWKNFKPEELATPEAFARNPVYVWSWYRWRRSRLAEVKPHAGHFVLAKWESRPADVHLITQNVDGLHHVAGSKNVLELHGRLDMARCTKCVYQVQGLHDLGEDPRCPECAARLRPGVVWFGESLPPGAIERAFERARTCDVLLVIGTSGVVQPAASLALLARRSGAKVIEINPGETPISDDAHLCIRAGCRDTLLALDAAWSTA
jgi:NAD-dependent deacetylase